MNDTNRLIIALDINLEIFYVDEFDNILNIKTISREGETLKPLNLSEIFDNIWQEIEQNYNFKSILFALGSKASFTDTRIIWIWIQSCKFFNSIDVYFYKNENFNLTFNQNILSINNLNLNDLINQSIKNPAGLTYLKDVKIH